MLYDDRSDLRAGVKLADADLIGIPHRIVVSKKTIENGQIEWKERSSNEAVSINLQECIARLLKK